MRESYPESRSNPPIRRARSILREFSLNTSTHGIPGIARSESIPNRIFWAVSTLIFAGIMSYFVTESILNFLKYPTHTLVSIIDDSTQKFPAVSICNYSPIRYDLFIGDFSNYVNNNNWTDTNNLTLTDIQRIQIQNFFRYKLNNNESITEYFFTLENMLIKCRYNQLECTRDDFVSFVDARYGLCYTFNARADHIRNGTLYKLAENGEWGLLELELYIHSHQYVPRWSSAIGILVQIHENDQIPLMHWRGHYLMPGRRQRMLFTRRKHNRLQQPYSECDKKVPPLLEVAFHHFGNATYTYEQYICAVVCIQIYVYTKCGCIDPNEWTARHMLSPYTNKTIIVPICSTDNRCYRIELDRINNDVDLWKRQCPLCVLECETTDFFTKISSLSAPIQWILEDLKVTIESLSVPLPKNWSETWQSEITENYIAFEVVSETQRLEILTDEESISPIDLLSNVGGHTGLWIGISFLSLMELAEMFYRLIRCKLYQLQQNFCQI